MRRKVTPKGSSSLDIHVVLTSTRAVNQTNLRDSFDAPDGTFTAPLGESSFAKSHWTTTTRRGAAFSDCRDEAARSAYLSPTANHVQKALSVAEGSVRDKNRRDTSTDVDVDILAIKH